MFKQIKYSKLNSRQKENYNFHKVASKLADYGFNSMRLNDDWEGADFIAINDKEMIKVQLKGRFSIDKKYIGKNLFIAFIEQDKVKIYLHDKAINMAPNNIINSKSWKDNGLYHWIKTPKIYNKIITVL
tara:strand:+ start:87 stop:473 length:387 start_codon:yes stop_codon:yes gene_type:complete